MIRHSTVLVLGAEASHPYGFPLGRELLFTIHDQLRSDNSVIGNNLLRLGTSVNRVLPT